MKVGVYVGSFNPVHKGHKNIIDFLLEKKYVDKIEIIPTDNYWNKNDLIDVSHRINMLKFYENDNIIVNTELNDLKYTYQILRKLNNENNELYLIIGSDNLLKFHLWKHYQELLKYKIIVIPRNNLIINEYKKQFKNSNFILAECFKEINISSTDIRENVKHDNISKLAKVLDNNVLNYIIEKDLYKGE